MLTSHHVLPGDQSQAKPPRRADRRHADPASPASLRTRDPGRRLRHRRRRHPAAGVRIGRLAQVRCRGGGDTRCAGPDRRRGQSSACAAGLLNKEKKQGQFGGYASPTYPRGRRGLRRPSSPPAGFLARLAAGSGLASVAGLLSLAAGLLSLAGAAAGVAAGLLSPLSATGGRAAAGAHHHQLARRDAAGSAADRSASAAAASGPKPGACSLVAGIAAGEASLRGRNRRSHRCQWGRDRHGQIGRLGLRRSGRRRHHQRRGRLRVLRRGRSSRRLSGPAHLASAASPVPCRRNTGAWPGHCDDWAALAHDQD